MGEEEKEEEEEEEAQSLEIDEQEIGEAEEEAKEEEEAAEIPSLSRVPTMRPTWLVLVVTPAGVEILC
jgi:hypothetical protein